MFNSKAFKNKKVGVILRTIVIILLINFFCARAFASDEFINQARSIIKNYYVDQVSDDALSKPTIKDIVSALNDPYSQYFTKEEYKKFIESINMQVTGIGVQIDSATEGIRIISVVEGSPAKEAGLKEGDIITEADNKKLTGLTLDEAVSYIKGEEGTTVHLQIRRADNYYSYDVIRKVISFPTVQGKILGNRIAYIKISSFGQTTSDDFKIKLVELNRYSPQGFIIDIRNNGGGYLNSAVNIAGNFISSKPVLLTRDRLSGDTIYDAPENSTAIDKPVILLVNGYSASASEILAAALKDYGKAYIVGTNTYGKGTVQTMFELFDKSVLKFTIQKFYSPFGKEINKVGVQPDFEVSGVDSLTVAELLMGNSGTSQYKKGYIKVNTGKQEFEIDLKKATQIEYWNALRYIINKSAAAGFEISIGTGDGWVRAYHGDIEKFYKLIYPEYKEIGELNGVPADKQITVKFTGDIDESILNNKNIELLDSSSGERIPLSFKMVDERSVKAIPSVNLKPGNTYYFVINSGLIGKDGSSLKEGTVTMITVKQ